MVNLKKIELRGFKSFADKVEIPFQEGVTAIIGPNGCGKSNVADAIRWALAEQSSKSLRGKSMQDVIFAGTEKRKSMSYCEVSLYFDNTGRRIFPDLAYDEVVITRKLDRGGLSEYYICGSRVKRTDLINFLRDTGIGKDGYSIIGQGRVDEVLSAKPEERRRIFEEAAQISSFRAERTDSLRNLERTKLNLQTVNQVIAEIEKSIGPLKGQAEKAKKYFALKDELKYHEVNQYIYNFENNQQTKRKIQEKIDKATHELRLKEEQYKECCLRYDRCIIDSETIDKDFENANAELLLLKVDQERIKGEAGVTKERISNLKNEIARLNEELNEIDGELVDSDKLLRETDLKKEGVMSNYISAMKQFEDAQAKYSRLSESLAGHESDLEIKNLDYVHALEELNILKANFSGFVTEKGINEDRAKNILALMDSKKERLSAELTALAISGGKLERATEEQRQIVNNYNECLSDKKDCERAVESCMGDINKLNNDLASNNALLQLYQSMKNDYTGYQEDIKRLMQASKKDPKLGGKIIGVIAELLRVPEKYETAIEYALGGSLQHIVVNTSDDAKDIIEYLKYNGYGRITFRPLNVSRPQSLSPECAGVLRESGVRGVASNLISYDRRVGAVVEALLGSTVIVDDINIAAALYKKYNQAFRIITLEGDVFNRSGEITGGAKPNSKGQQNLLSKDKQIDLLKAKVNDIQNHINMLRESMHENQDMAQKLEKDILNLSQRMSELKIEIGLNSDKSKQSEALVDSLKMELEADSAEYEKIIATIKEIDDKLKAVDELEKVVSEKKDEYNAQLASSKDIGTKQKSEREVLSEKVMQLRLDTATLKSELDALDAERHRVEGEKHELEEDKLNKIAEIKTVEANLDKILNAPEKASLTPEEEAKIKSLEETIAQLSQRKRTISDEIKSLDALKETTFNERQTLNETKLRNENMLENVDIEIRNQQQHLLEEYDLTYASALPMKDENYKIHGAITAISDLKKAINQLGAINPQAMEMLEEHEQRLQEQTLQRDDIQKACDDLNTIIDSITDKMREMFIAAFDKINENFKVIFSQLFGGGKGDLRLNFDETDDELEAGIDIFAQPPGKKLQNIGLLSGGERALTAIAILFAILKLKPMPFCLLDEIEAALDDSNVNLFAEFLKRFSDFTQFIVITHRKGTMRHADTIFGVTMEEKGVTKLVSIEFEEALKQGN